MSSVVELLPAYYWVSVAIAAYLLVEALVRNREAWARPAIAVYLTIGGWYFTEPFYFELDFFVHDPAAISAAYGQVGLFLVAFRMMVGPLSRTFAPPLDRRGRALPEFPVGRLLGAAAVLWVVVLLFGVWRMQGDLFHSLFPTGGRTAPNMWSRAAGQDAGATGFIVSSASYIYVLVLAVFGMLLPFSRTGTQRTVALILIAISWPFAFLQGSRNLLLAVAMPSLLSYYFFDRANRVQKLAVCAIAFLVLNYAMTLMISLRDVGFSGFLHGDKVNYQPHNGLNMASELVYINEFLDRGMLHLSYGGRYLAELVNFVPRAIWPNKPLIGIDYAVLRGFGGQQRDTGVYATLSTGVIGQGVVNFGRLLGPMVAALLMSAWVGLLARLWVQRTLLRACLFLLGIGLTFNMGRDLSLLVMWPFVFAFVAVKYLEGGGASGKFRLERHSEGQLLRRPIMDA